MLNVIILNVVASHSQHFISFVNYEWALEARVLNYTWLERLSRPIHKVVFTHMRKRELFVTATGDDNLKDRKISIEITLLIENARPRSLAYAFSYEENTSHGSFLLSLQIIAFLY